MISTNEGLKSSRRSIEALERNLDFLDKLPARERYSLGTKVKRRAVVAQVVKLNEQVEDYVRKLRTGEDVA